MKKSLIIVIIYLIFSLGFVLYNNSKKFIIINNDYMFEVSKKIKVVKKYPSYLDNTKINYYDGTTKLNGYINLKNNKLVTDQINGNNIDFYTEDYKKIVSDNVVATSRLKDINILNKEGNSTDFIGDNDREIVEDFLDKQGIDDYSIQNYNKYSIDINNDKSTDSIYIISNSSLNFINNYSLELPELPDDEDYYQYGFIRMGKSNIKLFEINEDNSSGIVFYELNNIFDIDGDSNYELNFSKYNYNDYNYHCESIFKLDNNQYIEYKNCNVEEE